MANFFKTPFDTAAKNFTIGGVTRLALIHRDQIVSYTSTKDAFGNPTKITAMTLATGEKFVPLEVVEDSASYTDEFKKGANLYYEQKLNFTVNVTGDEANERAHELNLGGRYLALAQRSTGEWRVLGLTNGLVTTATTGNSGAGADDAAGLVFTMTANNLGLACHIDETIVDALML